jgi:hypothetical protein
VPEEVHRCKSREDARNRALAWLERRGGAWGGASKPKIAKMGGAKGAEVGVTVTDGSHRVIREDWDDIKGPHFNVSAGKGGDKAAFCYPLSSDRVKEGRISEKMRARQRPRNEPRG